MVNKTADCFNNILFWFGKLLEKIYWKNGKQFNVGKDLISVQQERRAVAVSRSNFLFQSGFSQKDDEEKFDHSEKFAEKKAFLLMAFFCFICFVVVYIWVVKYRLKVFGTYLYAHWTYLWQRCIWNFSQYYNNLSFIEQ